MSASQATTTGRAASVTVALTCYNAAWCVERALDSVFAQTWLPDEVLVTDDGSTDDTVARIRRRYGDRVRLLEMPHRGLTPTRQDAIAASHGPWVALLDADDWWYPEKMERQVTFLAGHPEIHWISSDGRLISEHGVERESWLASYFDPVRTRHGDLLPLLVERCFPLVSSSLFRKDAYLAVGGLDTRIAFSQDYALWLALAARFPGAVLADNLIAYWTSPGQLSRRIEERYLDDRSLMERVVNGEYGERADIARIAREKLASYDYDLGLIALRGGRYGEAKARFWKAAAGPGTTKRRAIAWAGALLPTPLLAALRSQHWLKRGVDRSRRVNPMLRDEKEGGA